MLSKENNELLTQVGKGTPGGDLLRRYWHPIFPDAQLREKPVQKVRILGQDLTLYRDRSGKVGLIAERCPHRLASLHLGIPEVDGLRCCYHGWLFNEQGQCLEMPLEPPGSPFKENITVESYPVQEMGGLIWAYLGPDPAPLLPRWDLYIRPDGFRQIVAHKLPCNWLQVMENRGDLGHAIYLHGQTFQEALDRKGKLTDDPVARYNVVPAQQKAFLEKGGWTRYKPIYNRFGFTKAHLATGDSEDQRSWTIGMNPVIFPYMLANGPGDSGIRRLYQFGVPIDDTTTMHYVYFCYVVPPGVNAPKQDFVPYAEVPLRDENGEYIADYVLGQDAAVWVEQGPIMDRTQEHLAKSDTCVVAYRKLLQDQIGKVQAGEEPMNVFRDGDVDSLELTIPGNEGAAPVMGSQWGASLAFRYNYHKESKGGWLYIDDDADRFCPDRDVVVDIYRQTEALVKRQLEPS